jgi:phage terminase small subunit
MAVLSNPRHERFAQELAKGETADAAYVAAGFSENRGNATRLKANESVQARVVEIQGRAAVRAEITAADIARQLDADRDFARENGAASAAVAATMGKAKVLGLIIDKAENKNLHSIDEVLAELVKSG